MKRISDAAVEEAPFDLRRFDRRGWMTGEEDLHYIGGALDAAPHVRLLTPAQTRALKAVDKRALEAGLLGSDPDGLFKVQPKRLSVEDEETKRLSEILRGRDHA